MLLAALRELSRPSLPAESQRCCEQGYCEAELYAGILQEAAHIYIDCGRNRVYHAEVADVPVSGRESGDGKHTVSQKFLRHEHSADEAHPEAQYLGEGLQYNALFYNLTYQKGQTYANYCENKAV